MNTLINHTILNADLARNDFRYFLEQAFHYVFPGESFSENWHIAIIARDLEQILLSNHKRLVINVPPRSLKSFCVSVAWPAWLLGKNPANKIMVASYSQHLANKLSLDCRHLMSSDWFKYIFPDFSFAGDQNQKHKFISSERGFRFATSVGGTATGEGGDVLIIDDPHNAAHIHSNARRKKVHNWFQQSFSSRLNDKKNGIIVLVMQRLHEDDLTSFIIKNDPLHQWQKRVIPAIADLNQDYPDGKVVYHFSEKAILHSDREGKKELERAKNELGGLAFAAQYLQKPAIACGEMLNRSWLRYYQLRPTTFISLIHSWDTAIKSGDGHSYSVSTVWGYNQQGYYLLDVVRERLEYPELKRTIIDIARRDRPVAILIEDKASGQSLLQDLKREHNLPVIGIRPTADKLTRFASVTPLFEAGLIYLPTQSHWLETYIAELTSFPGGGNDDQVDSTSQYLNYMLSNKKRQPSIRVL